MKITRLTPEQEAEIPRFLQHYLGIALGGGRIDRGVLEAALVDAYALVGEAAPKLLIFDSPVACMFAMDMDDFEPSKLKEQLENQLKNQLRKWLEIQLRGLVRESLWDQIWYRLGHQLEDRLGNGLGDQLDVLVNGEFWNEEPWNPNYLGGIHDLYWIACYRFAQHIGVQFDGDTSHRLDIMERISTQSQWWWPHQHTVIASERPTMVRWDAEQRLHCEDGPAIEYADGCSFYLWHGNYVPAHWITDKAITPQEALTWPTLEQRRAACEILGWANILDALDARIIDQDPNPEIGALIEATLPDIGKERFLKVRCPTGRTFAIPVPPDMTSALQANAWTYGFDDPDDYQLEVRT